MAVETGARPWPGSWAWAVELNVVLWRAVAVESGAGRGGGVGCGAVAVVFHFLFYFGPQFDLILLFVALCCLGFQRIVWRSSPAVAQHDHP